MSTQQHEALRLADWLFDNVEHINHADAAAELRRLHALNAELLDALKQCRDMVGHPDNVALIDSALAKAEGREA